MTRRELGKLAAAGSAALLPAARAANQNKYAGPLEGFADKVDAAAFDPVLYTRKLYESAPLRLTFRAQNRKQAEAWQKRLRAKLTELRGRVSRATRAAQRRKPWTPAISPPIAARNSSSRAGPACLCSATC